MDAHQGTDFSVAGALSPQFPGRKNGESVSLAPLGGSLPGNPIGNPWKAPELTAGGSMVNLQVQLELQALEGDLLEELWSRAAAMEAGAMVGCRDCSLMLS